MEHTRSTPETASPKPIFKKRSGIILQPLFKKEEKEEIDDKQEKQEENEEDIAFNKISKIILKPKLTLDDIQIVAFYLGKLKELIKFLNLEGSKLDDLLTQIALHLKYEHFNEERILFKYGEKGNKFYIILSGYVTIIKPTEITLQMTEDEYMMYLLNLRKLNEIKLLTSSLNNSNNQLENYNNPGLILWLKNKEQFDEKILKIFDEKSELYKELKMLTKMNLELNQNDRISPDEFINRYKINKFNSLFKKPEKTYSIFTYEKVLTIGKGCNFGDSSLVKGESNRNATVIVYKDTYLGSLEKITYESCIMEVNEKIRKRVIDQFLSNKLFYGFNKNIFSSKLLHLFVKRKVYRNDLIIKEGEKPRDIYLIMKGEFEIYTKKSLSDLDKIISKHRANKFTIYQDPKELEKIEKFPKYKKFLQEKTLIKIGISEPGDVLGLDDSIIENCYTYTAECTSIFAEVFLIDRQNFFNILSSFNEIKKNYEQFIKSKKSYIIQRFSLMFDSKLKLFNNQNNYNIDSTKNPLLNSISYDTINSINTNSNKKLNTFLSKQVNYLQNEKKNSETIKTKKLISLSTVAIEKDQNINGKTIESLKSLNNKMRENIRYSSNHINVLDEEVESTKNVSFSNISFKKYNETKEFISSNRIQSSQIKKRNPSAGILIRMSIKNSKEKIRLLLKSASLKDALSNRSNRNKDNNNLESIITKNMSIPNFDKCTKNKADTFKNHNVSLKLSCSFSKRRLINQKTPMPIKIFKDKKIKAQKISNKKNNKIQTTHLLNIVKINDFSNNLYNNKNV